MKKFGIVENGERVKYKLVLNVKNIRNIFDDENVKDIRVANILNSLSDLMREFEEMTGNKPSNISLSSDLYYLVRDALDIEEPDKSHYGDSCIFREITVKGGCSLKGCEVVLSSWTPKSIS